MSQNPSILERIRAREPIALDAGTMAAALAYFRTNPQEDEVYVRWDGVCLSGARMRRNCGTRTGQLVSMATDGIPMRVSRLHKHVAAELAKDKAEDQAFANQFSHSSIARELNHCEPETP